MSDNITAGYGESVITPPIGVELCGYGFYRGRCAESVLDDLKARAVCVSAGGATLFLIACDLIGFDVETSDRIRNAIAAEYHIPIKNILLACTHTHSGPAAEFLRGCGEIAPEYMRRVPELIQEAARRAAFDRRSCEVQTGAEQAEPIGFNRRFSSFQPIDPMLSAVIFKRVEFSICVFSYSCHAVTLGPNTAVSADWPGAAVKTMEGEGCRCVCFQGFCGDINPVCRLNEAPRGTPADLTLYGMILKHHILNIERRSQSMKIPFLTAFEKRVSLRLELPPGKEFIDKEYKALLAKEDGKPVKRFAEEWRQAAEASFARFHQHPYLDDIPIQAMRLNEMNLIALPGEIFCEYGLKLRSQFPPLMTIGYANGNTGYWPVKSAFTNPDDYAAYRAPKIYGVFPFASSLEETVQNICGKMLSEVQAGKSS